MWSAKSRLFSVISRRKIGPCFPAVSIAVNFGNARRNAIAKRHGSTINLDCRNSTRWKASCSGATPKKLNSVWRGAGERGLFGNAARETPFRAPQLMEDTDAKQSFAEWVPK